MENRSLVLKALADDTRMQILELLLRHNYCVSALARKSELSEAAISQHIKVLREADLLIGQKRGYFMHYDVNRKVLANLSNALHMLSLIPKEVCTPKQGGCTESRKQKCHHSKEV